MVVALKQFTLGGKKVHPGQPVPSAGWSGLPSEKKRRMLKTKYVRMTPDAPKKEITR